MPIELPRMLFSLAIVIGTALFVFFLQRSKTILTEYGAVKFYQKTSEERRADLEVSPIRTAEEEEELMILRGQDAHDRAIRTYPILDMIHITSPMMHAEKEKNRVMMLEKYGSCPPCSPPMLSRTPNVMRWELTAKAAAAAEVGSLFCYAASPNFPDETQMISYLILRVNTPERWKHLEITHRTVEDLTEIVSNSLHVPCTALISPPNRSIIEMVWKPLSAEWTHVL